MTHRIALLGAALIGTAMPAQAEAPGEQSTTLDTVLVEGSRLDQSKTEIGSSVTILTEEDIDRLGVDFAVDAIATAPGVTVNQNGAFGGVASVRIRGAASSQSLVLIDGVPVNDTSAPGGGFDFARLDTANIARIEVLKGPQSTLWGTDAIGGVLAITTKRPEAGFGGSAFGEYGAFDTWRGGAALGKAGKTGDYRLAVTGMSSDGISKANEANGNSEADGYDSLTLSAGGGLNLPAGARLDATALWSDAEAEFDSFSFGAEGSVADGDEISETEDFAGHVSLRLPLLDDRLENLFVLGYSQISRASFVDGAPGFSAEGERRLYRYQGTLRVDERNTLAFGAEREDTSADGEGSDIEGLFALYEFKPTGQITLTGGLRRDETDRFGSETTARLAGAYNPTPGLTLRASWGQGFKAPTIFQTTFFCCGASVPNADLDAETSEAFDIGADWRSADGRAEAGITFFDQDTENLIDFSFALGGYENIASVASRGIELFGRYQLADWLTVSANYARINAETGSGDPLVALPEHSGDVTVSLDPDGPFSGAVLVRYNGEEETIDTTTLDGWTRVDLTGSYQLTQRAELYGRIENLFDSDYQQVLGYGTPGLSGSLGLRVRY